MKDKYKAGGTAGTFKRIKYYARKSGKTAKLKSLVRREIANVTEMKYIDSVYSSNIDGRAVATIGAYFPMTVLGPGTGDTQRLGDKIHINSLTLRGIIYMNQAATTGNQSGWF